MSNIVDIRCGRGFGNYVCIAKDHDDHNHLVVSRRALAYVEDRDAWYVRNIDTVTIWEYQETWAERLAWRISLVIALGIAIFIYGIGFYWMLDILPERLK